MRVVLDTNVLVAAARSATGASHYVMRAVERNICKMLCSPALFLEYEEVLLRPEHCQNFGHTRQSVREYLDGLALLIEPVSPDFRYRPMLDDADDDMAVEVAMNGQATAIVTHNAKDFSPVHGPPLSVPIWSPADLLGRLVG